VTSYGMRKLKNNLASIVAFACVIVAIIPLASILIEVVSNGAPALSWRFLSGITLDGGGIGNAILGTLLLILYASAIGLPIGILTGIYISEYGNNRFGSMVRFFNDVMANFPSIVIGLLAYSLVVVSFGIGFSLIAGAFALSIIMIPIVASTTEEALKMVPNSLREASLALGVPRWKTVLRVMLSNGRAGIVTGALLSVARVAGETAPLIPTTLFNNFWSTSPTQETAALPQLIFRYAMGHSSLPVDEATQQAWGAALVLILIVLSLNVIVRLLTIRRFGGKKGEKMTWKERLSHRT
jgi:phosphate transport system permease protein